jgi:hypothetical protein
MEGYPGNFHYYKNIKLIGGADLNVEKHVSEYKKRFIDRFPEGLQKNQPYYLQALAARQHKRYMQIVHGGEGRNREFKAGGISRNQTIDDRGKCLTSPKVIENRY